MSVMLQSVQLFVMAYQKVSIEMKAEHIELLDLLKQEYGVQSRSRVLEMLLNDLLKQDSEAQVE